MIAEVAVIKALTDGGLTMVFAGAVPQPEGKQEVPLPVTVINRVASEWFNTFCGVDQDLSQVSIQVDYYARSGLVARTQADVGRKLIGGMLPIPPSLTNEITIYDDQSRAWRTIQSWTVADYAPSIPSTVET